MHLECYTLRFGPDRQIFMIMSGRRDGGLRSPILLVDKEVAWLLLCSPFPSLTRTIYSDTFVRFSLRLVITCSYLTVLLGPEAQ